MTGANALGAPKAQFTSFLVPLIETGSAQAAPRPAEGATHDAGPREDSDSEIANDADAQLSERQLAGQDSREPAPEPNIENQPGPRTGVGSLALFLGYRAGGNATAGFPAPPSTCASRALPIAAAIARQTPGEPGAALGKDVVSLRQPCPSKAASPAIPLPAEPVAKVSPELVRGSDAQPSHTKTVGTEDPGVKSQPPAGRPMDLRSERAGEVIPSPASGAAASPAPDSSPLGWCDAQQLPAFALGAAPVPQQESSPKASPHAAQPGHDRAGESAGASQPAAGGAQSAGLSASSRSSLTTASAKQVVSPQPTAVSLPIQQNAPFETGARDRTPAFTASKPADTPPAIGAAQRSVWLATPADLSSASGPREAPTDLAMAGGSSTAAAAADGAVLPLNFSEGSMDVAKSDATVWAPAPAQAAAEALRISHHPSQAKDGLTQDPSAGATRPDTLGAGRLNAQPPAPEKLPSAMVLTPASPPEDETAAALAKDFPSPARPQQAGNAARAGSRSDSPVAAYSTSSGLTPSGRDSALSSGAVGTPASDVVNAPSGARSPVPGDGLAFGAVLVPMAAGKDPSPATAPPISAAPSDSSAQRSAKTSDGEAGDDGGAGAAAEISKTQDGTGTLGETSHQPAPASAAAKPPKGTDDPGQSRAAGTDRSVSAASGAFPASDSGSIRREAVQDTLRQDGAPEPPRTPAESPADSQAARAPAKNLSFELGGGEQRVVVHIADHGGEIHLAVRTPDADLAADLRRELPTLASRLEQSGLRPQEWQSGENGRHAQQPNGTGWAQPGQHEGSSDSRQRREGQARDPESGNKSDFKKEGKEFAWFLSSLG